jgi:hypothetical protein
VNREIDLAAEERLFDLLGEERLCGVRQLAPCQAAITGRGDYDEL